MKVLMGRVNEVDGLARGLRHKLSSKVVIRLLLVAGMYSSVIFGVAESFSVVTWNVLGSHAPDLESYRHSGSKFSFDDGDFNRFDTTARVLNSFSADILCLQEFAESFQKSKNSAFRPGAFNYTSVSYMQKGNKNGVVLYVKNNLHDLKVKDHGSVGLAAPGACAWGVFENINKERVLVGSVHIGRANQRSGMTDGAKQWNAIAAELQQVLVKHQPCSLVLAGDFNTFYEEVLNETRKYLTALFGTSIEMYCHNSWTANSNNNFDFSNKAQDLKGKGGPDDFDFCSIDHVVYTNKSLKFDGNRSWVGDPSNPYKDTLVEKAHHKLKYENVTNKNIKLIHAIVPSDHLPVFVTFEFKSAQGIPDVGKAQVPDAIKQRMFAKQALELAVCL